MRFLALLVLLVPVTICAQEAGASRPITPEEALKRVDQKVTVAMEIRSTGGNTARYLNSEADFRDNKNFAVFIPNAALGGFKQAGIADPGEFFKGKTIIVTGTVVMAQGHPQIRVENSNQIKVVGAGAPGAVKRPASK
jgi:hypothetical protein